MDFSTLIPQFGNLAFTLGAFILALLVIVAIHEYGHYIVGRWCGIHSEKFSLGFGPVIWSRRDRRGTLWQIAALPFGGFVKFLGDNNAASVGGEIREGVDPRRTMLGAPLWARAATVAAGPMANFLLSALIFIGLFSMQGRTAEPLQIERLTALPPAFTQELAPGDTLLAVGDQQIETLSDFSTALDAAPEAETVPYTVERDGQRMTVIGPHPLPPVAQSISPRSAAYRAGMEQGDVITAIDGTPVFSFPQIKAAVEAGQGASLTLTLWNDGTSRDVTLTPKVTDIPSADGGFETRYLIGIVGGALFEPVTEAPGLWTVLSGSVMQVWDIIAKSMSGLWHMLTGAISTCNLSSPIGIADTSGAMAAQGTESFIFFIAFLSTAVGLMNLFPIPVLDGGHLVFHAWEAVTGKPPSARALRIATTLGFSLILTLMGFAMLNDLIFCR